METNLGKSLKKSVRAWLKKKDVFFELVLYRVLPQLSNMNVANEEMR